MAWIIAFVALTLVMTVLALAEFRQPVKAHALKLPDLSVGDRVIAAFVVLTFAVAFVSELTLLTVKLMQ
jgi:hypothetical protein